MKKLIFSVVAIALIIACGFALKKWYIKNDSRVYADLPLCLINVLDKNEFDDAHISGSLNIPFDQIESVLSLIPKDKKVIFYCANYLCTASGEAAVLFKKHGFKDVYVYEGGMAEWYQMSLSDENYHYKGPAQLSYLQIAIPRPNSFSFNAFEEKGRSKKKEEPGFVVLEAKELQEMLESFGL